MAKTADFYIDKIKEKNLPVELDVSTFTKGSVKAKFIDKDFGEFWCIPSLVVTRGTRHKDFQGKSLRLTLDVVKNRIEQKHGGNVSFTPEDYKQQYEKILFLDKDFGYFEALPRSVMRGMGHPKRKEESIKQKRFDTNKRELRSTPRWVTKEQKKIMRDLKQTAVLKSKYMGEPYDLDHIIPLNAKNMCGLNVPWNLEVVRKKENILKRNIVLWWRAGGNLGLSEDEKMTQAKWWAEVIRRTRK